MAGAQEGNAERVSDTAMGADSPESGAAIRSNWALESCRCPCGGRGCPPARVGLADDRYLRSIPGNHKRTGRPSPVAAPNCTRSEPPGYSDLGAAVREFRAAGRG